MTKIIQIQAVASDIYGLTESGALVRYDQHSGVFVMKCEGDIVGQKKASELAYMEPRIVEADRRRSTISVKNKEELPLILVVSIIASFSILAGLIYLFFS